MALDMIKMSADTVNIPWLRISGLAANLFRLTKQFSLLALAILWEHSYFFSFFFKLLNILLSITQQDPLHLLSCETIFVLAEN